MYAIRSYYDGNYGIFSYEPSGRVLDNIVTDQQQYGIFISDSVNISAINNTLVNNTKGLVIRYGKNQNGVFRITSYNVCYTKLLRPDQLS